MKQANINVERGRNTPKPSVLHTDTYPIIQKWILRFLCVCGAATTAARATIGNTDPITSAFFLRFLCEPCNRAPALQETGKDSAHICALLYKQPPSPSAVDCACNKKVTYWPT